MSTPKRASVRILELLDSSAGLDETIPADRGVASTAALIPMSLKILKEIEQLRAQLTAISATLGLPAPVRLADTLQSVHEQLVVREARRVADLLQIAELLDLPTGQPSVDELLALIKIELLLRPDGPAIDAIAAHFHG